MKVLERLEFIDRIGRTLQGRMSYGEIDTYLKAHGVDIKRTTSGVNSKWVYSKELLAQAPSDKLIKIADELGVPHNHVVADPGRTLEATFWEPFHFRVFLSHLSSFKKTTGQLQAALRPYGVSAFVAHVDIEPTREWMGEIEAGLHSMDALVAILMPGFKESNWTDQEVGVAVGRGVLVIPVMRGLEPHGFMSKYQGLHAQGKTVGNVAADLFKILANSPRTRTKMLSCLIETTLQAQSPASILEKLGHIASVKDCPQQLIVKLQEGAAASQAFSEPNVIKELNVLLAKYGLKPLSSPATPLSMDDDIPF
jgi:hypothetical protein